MSFAYPSLSMRMFSGFKLKNQSVIPNKFYLLSVHYAILVEAFEGKKNISCIKFCAGFFKSSDLLNVEKEFTTWTVVQYQKEFFGRLECKVHLHDKRVSYALEDLTLGHCILDLLFLADESLL